MQKQQGSFGILFHLGTFACVTLGFQWIG